MLSHSNIEGKHDRMSTPISDQITSLPTLAALDAHVVLDGKRRGASVQLDDTYFEGQQQAFDAVELPSLSSRRNLVEQSGEFYDQIQVDFDSLSEETLWTASERYGQILQQVPEIQYLQRQFPETCFVVPEWERSGQQVSYGSRVYFFRDDSAPDPEGILQRNIDAVVEDDSDQFKQYQGHLHGYPDCCIEYFATYDRGPDAAPELESLKSIREYVDDERIGDETRHSHSIEEIVDGVFETPDVYAFFAREFFPEPGCDRARRRGIDIYESLSHAYPDALVEDYFRVNVGWSYQMARATAHQRRDRSRPSPGSLGREHLLLYLPLSATCSLSKYVEE
jgi:hypothetical protein